MISRGFLIYAHNNEEIDYGKLALTCALMIKANAIEKAVCLVTDQGTLDWLIKSVGREKVDYAFDHIRLLTHDEYTASATRKRFLDTSSTSKILSWFNGGRSSAYEISPFDETIMIDSDLLVQDTSLDLAWGNDEDVMINKRAVTLNHTLPSRHERRLDGMGIQMYWATIVFFRKSEKAKLLFELVQHIKERYSYYQFVYEFPGKLFRNDYAFSIAIHMLNGFLENDEFKSLPVETILSSFDTDELIAVRKNELVFLVGSTETTWKFTTAVIKNLNVHVMNKYALSRHADTIIDLYYPKDEK